MRFCLLCCVLLSSFFISKGDDGFNNQLVSDEFDQPVGITFLDSLAFVWEKKGQVYLLINGQKQDPAVLDISEEVAGFYDSGLLGFALDPDFYQNGYVYLFYAVDRHHLMHYGTPDYDPNENDFFNASICRLTRYQLNADEGFKTVVEGSRKILLGETPEDGVPFLTYTHGTGTVLFGRDGSMLLSTGDGSAYHNHYMGKYSDERLEDSHDVQGLEDGIISEAEDVGGFRAQYLYGLNGKILRIDPETGQGLPSNPFYDAASPDAPVSKVWALGLRNPYRMTLKPGTGSTNPEDGNPGTLYIGDVGFYTWEELNILQDGGENFGWPIYEGLNKFPPYNQFDVYNEREENPLYPQCEDQYFSFHDLIKQPNFQHDVDFTNPCYGDPIPEDVPTFMHKRPAITYSNSAASPPVKTQIPDFNEDGDPIAVDVEDLENPVEPFDGTSAIGGCFYTGEAFPSEYHQKYFMADYSDGSIKVMDFNDEEEFKGAEIMTDTLGAIVHLDMNPDDGCLYYTKLNPGELRKICFGGNISPVAQFEYDEKYGDSPHTVQFTGENSYDNDGEIVDFEWDFGDGSLSQEANPEHTFTADGTVAYEVSLTVTDNEGATHTTEDVISVNNTPPQIQITSFEDNDLYPVVESYVLQLESEMYDDQTDKDQLDVEWSVYLHHNTHYHLLDKMAQNPSSFDIIPLGCGEETYYYRIELKVTDPHGLSSTSTKYVYPDCDSVTSDPDDEPETPNISLYPNPAERYVRYSIIDPDHKGRYTVSIYDNSGSEVNVLYKDKDKTKSTGFIDVSRWVPGVYFIKFNVGDMQKSFKINKI